MSWIKLRTDLWTDSRIVTLASRWSVTTCHAVGIVARFWALADSQVRGETWENLTPDVLDRMLDFSGAAAGLEGVGWLVWLDGNRAQLPRYTEHNGSTAKTRAQTAKRQERFRNAPGKCVTHPSRTCVTREEKKREETTPPPPPPAALRPETGVAVVRGVLDDRQRRISELLTDAGVSPAEIARLIARPDLTVALVQRIAAKRNGLSVGWLVGQLRRPLAELDGDYPAPRHDDGPSRRQVEWDAHVAAVSDARAAFDARWSAMSNSERTAALERAAAKSPLGSAPPAPDAPLTPVWRGYLAQVIDGNPSPGALIDCGRSGASEVLPATATRVGRARRNGASLAPRKRAL